MSQNSVISLNNTKSLKGRRRKKLRRKSVLKMLAVMEASQSAGPSSSADTSPPTPDTTTHVQEFLSSGRTGRRNALPDILGQHANVTSSDLPSKLQGLSTADNVELSGSTVAPQDQPGTSKS